MTKQQVITMYNNYVDLWNQREFDITMTQEKWEYFENIFPIKVYQLNRIGYKTKQPEQIIIDCKQTGEIFVIAFNKKNPQFEGGLSFKRINISSNNIYKIKDHTKKSLNSKIKL